MLLETRALRKNFGKLEVLKGIDLQIEEKQVLSIVGPSGAGKTTLLNIVSTLDDPSSGSVLVREVDVQTLSTKAKAHFRNLNIGIVFQFHNLLPEFTAIENVCIPGFIAGKPKAEVKDRARMLLEMLGLQHRNDHKPSELSGGEQQRVSVARALINEPKLIFADEPSGNLDTQNANDLHQLFFDLRDQFGLTFVIVTHNKGLALQCDRTITITDGKITSDEWNKASEG